MEEENKTKYCILYVDDEEDNLVVFKSAFRRNYNVLTATSAAEGLEIVKHQAVDMIITDQRMPLMTGIQFLKSLPEDIMSIRMILTGYSDIEAVIEAINTGKVYKYITKPWNKDELQITLDKALETLDLKRKNIELVNNLKSANEKLEQKVKDRTLELEQKNKDITDSITYAKRIQESILPEMKNYNANFSEYFVLYKPKDIVSGDFYWLLEKDDDVFFAAVDCTGHGVPGAFMSIIGYNSLNKIVNEKGITNPAEILKELSMLINITLKQNTLQGSPDGMDISLCRYNKKEKHLTLASAMRPVFTIINGKPNIIEPSKVSIGGRLNDSPVNFDQHSFEVNKGDCVYLYTDGYADQFGGEHNKKLFSKNFIEILSSLGTKAMADQKVYLENYMDLWKGKNEQVDDILVIGVKF